MTISVSGVKGLPLIRPGNDLALMIVEHSKKQGLPIQNGDIVVIGQKAVSKAEGRLVDITNINPSTRARLIAKKAKKSPEFVEIVLRDAKRVVRASSEILIVTTKHGWTCLNGGVDKSNVQGDDNYALLPRQPDASARRIRKRIEKLTHRKIGVLITDTHSRPFRLGQVEETIGISGFSPFIDYRGQRDLFGYQLRFKNVAIADELAAAAELVMGQGRERTPVAIIKGVTRLVFGQRAKSSQLVVRRAQDLFRGTL